MKRPNKRWRKQLRQLMAIDDENVLFRRVMRLPGIESISMSDGYYGSTRITMQDGKEILELARDREHWHNPKPGMPHLHALREAMLRSQRYWRRRSKRYDLARM